MYYRGHPGSDWTKSVTCYAESPDGIRWRALDPPASPPWRASSPLEIKYDFDIVVTKERGSRRAIHAFGGDRETFGFPPPSPLEFEDDLRVDNDVWRFAPPAQ